MMFNQENQSEEEIILRRTRDLKKVPILEDQCAGGCPFSMGVKLFVYKDGIHFAALSRSLL
jgi:hypothetical protein